MLAYALFLPAVTGFLLVCYFSRCDTGQSFFERFSLGFGLGMGILTFEMFITALLKIKFSLLILSLIQILTAVLCTWQLLKANYSIKDILNISLFNEEEVSFFKSSKVRSFFILIIAGWILLKLLFVIYEGAVLPVNAWDSLDIWSSGAKFFFYEKGLALDPGNEHFFSKGYRTFPNYPLNVPLMQVWISICLGDIHEVYMKYWDIVYFVGVVVLLFFSVKRESNLLIGIMAAFSVSTVPLLTRHALDAYAELTLAYYALSAAICFQRYMKKSEQQIDNNYGFLLLIGMFAALCLWTKMEGLFFTLALSATLFLYAFLKKNPIRTFLTNICVYLIPIIVIGTSWYVFLLFFSIGGRGVLISPVVHCEVIRVILDQIFLSANFNIVFSFFLAIVSLGIGSIFNSELKYLLLPLLMVMGMYLSLYLATSEFVFALNLEAVDRNILTFIPLMYYISALITAKLLSGYNAAHQKAQQCQ